MKSSEWIGSRVLVTGGAGFLGSHLCDQLIRDGMYVTAVDDFTTGHTRNVAHLLDHPRFSLVEYDVMSPFFFPVDYIYNLACPASPAHYQRNPSRTTLINVMGALHCLELARAQNARFFQASTSEVYGDPIVHPQHESYTGSVNPIGVRACYDEGKRCAESLTMDYHRQYGVDVRIVRIFNTYGPRMALDDGRVISNFIVQALRGEDLTVYGAGTQTRSFCYVDDLIAGFVRFMHQNDSVGPLNLGNPEEFTILELAEQVLEQVGGRSKLVMRPLPKDDPQQRKPNIQLAQRMLGFKPTTRLCDGLRSTIAYFRRLLSSEFEHTALFAEPAQ